MVTNNFWEGKTVFLTGHTGFKGSWLSLWLKKLKVNLIGFSKSVPTEPSLYYTANVENGLNSIFGDVTDYELLKSCLEKSNPEIVIHMAAQAIVSNSYKNPIETYSTNIMGTVNLLEACRYVPSIKSILIVTSDKCYDVQYFQNKPFTEDNPMGGNDPYSSSKGCAELVTSAYRKSFFNELYTKNKPVSIITARGGNVIGGGDWSYDRLIPDIVRSILENKSLNLRNPNSIRPWQHVLDLLHGYMTLIEKSWNMEKFSPAWNFGPIDPESKNVKWIVDTFYDLWGKQTSYKVVENKNILEVDSLKLDPTKARTELNWNPKLNLISSLQFTADWYKNYEQGENMQNFSENQINTYNSIK